MANSNGSHRLLITICAGLAVTGIISAVAGYGNDQKQDEQIVTVQRIVQEHDEEIRELHDASLRTEGHLKNIDEKIARITTAIEKIAEK